MHARALGLISAEGDPTINVMQSNGRSISRLVDTLDKVLHKATAERAILGAVQNRLEFTLQSLNIASENLSASESRIRDADMAREMMGLTKANILQQAATAMLAQANQNNDVVLQLLT